MCSSESERKFSLPSRIFSSFPLLAKFQVTKESDEMGTKKKKKTYHHYLYTMSQYNSH